MGYIVDLTIILEGLFWLKLAQPKLPQIIEDDVDASFHLYSQSEQRAQVHQEIRSFVDRMNFIDAMHPDESHVEVVRLIHTHRRNFIDGTGWKDPEVARQTQAAASNVSDQAITVEDHSNERATATASANSSVRGIQFWEFGSDLF